jgi:predicted aspartyl protease
MSKILHSQDYDHHNFDPAMPILDVGISRPGAPAPAVFVEAIIDTGADGTMIPLHLLHAIGVPTVGSAFIRGITGKRQQVEFYVVTLHLSDMRVYAVQAAGLIGGDTAILGRDVINQLDLALHGPAEVLEVLR